MLNDACPIEESIGVIGFVFLKILLNIDLTTFEGKLLRAQLIDLVNFLILKVLQLYF